MPRFNAVSQMLSCIHASMIKLDLLGIVYEGSFKWAYTA